MSTSAAPPTGAATASPLKLVPSNSSAKTATPGVMSPASPVEPLELQEPGNVSEAPPSMTKDMRRLETEYFAATCLSLFMAGWNDASAGPLLPRMQSSYHVGFAVVSLIFILNCVGFVSAAVMNIWLTDRFGFGKVIFLGAICQVAAYAIQSPRPPFPLMVISYAINGFGMGLQDAQANGLVANLPTSADAKMSMMHGVYGLGAFVSPLVATQFSKQKRWNFHFLASLGVGIINAAALAIVYKFKPQEDLLRRLGVHTADDTSSEEGGKYRQIMRLKVVHLMAFFIFVYVGVEVTIGGWMVTFVQQRRGGGTNAGYVSSGFFGGLTLGRVALIWVNRLIGERRAIFVYGILAIGLELTIWFVPSLIENAIAVAFVGVVLGPFYPIVMNIASALIPRQVLTGSIGWIASIGQTGSAAFPFILAVIAQKHGVQTLQPLLVAMIAFMLFIWYLVPSPTRRTE